MAIRYEKAYNKNAGVLEMILSKTIKHIAGIGKGKLYPATGAAEKRLISLQFPLNNKGFTLVEVVIAALILTITVTAFATLFGTGVKNIYSTGGKGNALYQAQQDMDQNIVKTTSGNDILTLYFPNSISVSGTILTSNIPYKNNNGVMQNLTVSTFVPNKNQ